MNTLNEMLEKNQNITHILITMIEQNQEVTNKINKMAQMVEKDVMLDIPDTKDVSTQFPEENSDIIKTNFYWKLQYLASDDLGLDVLKRILNVRPSTLNELAEVFLKAVGDTFAEGIEPVCEVEDDKSSDDCEKTKN